MRELTLNERKNFSLEILNELADICDKYSIKYFLAYGSLLGAIRHKGFIPWDDDIDVWVPIEQYGKLLEILSVESKYTVKNHLTDINWYFPMSKLSNDSTMLLKEDERHPERFQTKYGVSIDIFPLFHCDDMKKIKACQKAYKWRVRMFSYRHNLYQSFLRRMICEIMDKIGFNERYFVNKYTKIQFAEYKSNKVGFPLFAYFEKDIHQAYCFETCEVMFENREYHAPLGYHEILSSIYGEYMQLPPEEKRVSNHDVKAYILNE